MVGKEWKQESAEGNWNGWKGMEARKGEDKEISLKLMEARKGRGLRECLERNGSKKVQRVIGMVGKEWKQEREEYKGSGWKGTEARKGRG